MKLHRFLSILLAVCMIFTGTATAFAEEMPTSASANVVETGSATETALYATEETDAPDETDDTEETGDTEKETADRVETVDPSDGSSESGTDDTSKAGSGDIEDSEAEEISAGETYTDETLAVTVNNEDAAVDVLDAEGTEKICRLEYDGYEEVYASLISAIDDVPENKKSTITMLADTEECVTIEKNRWIILDLNGFTINGNGGSRVIYNKGSLELEDNSETMSGTVTGGAGEDGCGIYNEGSVTMYGGTITENESESDGGGVYNRNQFVMQGGSITGNSSAGNGGGVYNAPYDKDITHFPVQFVMQGGSITDNSAAGNGGGAYNVSTDDYESIFTMHSKTSISGNASGENGGGVYNEGRFTSNGGSITGNSSEKNGGGIYNTGISSITQSGSATGNSAGKYGGGVYNQGEFAVADGAVTGNSAGEFGGGVLQDDQASKALTVYGKAIIKDNTAGTEETADDCRIIGESKISISESGLSDRAYIGVGMAEPGAFTDNGSADDAGHFFSNDESYYVSFATNHLELKKKSNITCNQSVNGTVKADKNMAAPGETVCVTVTPAEGFKLDQLYYCEEHEEVKNNILNNTFTMPDTDVVIKATFVKSVYGGSSSSGGAVVQDTMTFTVAGTGTDAVPAKVTWIKNDDQSWSCGNAGVVLFKDTWGCILNTDNKTSDWYYFDEAGKMQTGFRDINGNTYYFREIKDAREGAMETGVQNIGNQYYYFEPTAGATQGIMLYHADVNEVETLKIDSRTNSFIYSMTGATQ